MTTGSSLRSVRLNQFVDLSDYLRLVLEVANFLLICTHTWTEVHTIRRTGLGDYLNFWNTVGGMTSWYCFICLRTIPSE